MSNLEITAARRAIYATTITPSNPMGLTFWHNDNDEMTAHGSLPVIADRLDVPQVEIDVAIKMVDTWG